MDFITEQLDSFHSPIPTTTLPDIVLTRPDGTQVTVSAPNESIPMIHMKDLQASTALDAPPGTPRVVKLDTFTDFVHPSDAIAKLGGPIISAMLGDDPNRAVQCCRFEFCATCCFERGAMPRPIPQGEASQGFVHRADLYDTFADPPLEWQPRLRSYKPDDRPTSRLRLVLFPDEFIRQVRVCDGCPEEMCRAAAAPELQTMLTRDS